MFNIFHCIICFLLASLLSQSSVLAMEHRTRESEARQHVGPRGPLTTEELRSLCGEIEKGVPGSFGVCSSLARAGDPGAQFLCGLTYRYGWGGERRYDLRSARAWLERAARSGNSLAFLVLGYMDQNGEGGPKNCISAALYYKKAMRLGDPDACIAYACLFLVGEGVTKNVRKAVRILTNFLAQEFHPGVAFTLAEIHRERNTPEDHEKAEQWYLAAAGHGHTQSQYRIGVYASQRGDWATAEACFKCARATWHPGATTQLEMLREKQAEEHPGR